MKKLFLSILFFIFSLFSFAQEFYQAKLCTIQKYIDDEWKQVSKFEPQSIFVIIKDAKFKITNEAESTFIVYGEVTYSKHKTHQTYYWQAYDDKGRDCTLFIKTPLDSDNIKELSIMFQDVCVTYTFSD